MAYQCHYCKFGTVESIPAKCPACEAQLTVDVETLTPEELAARERKNALSHFSLAVGDAVEVKRD